MAGSSELLWYNMADMETFEAALKYVLRKRGMAESFLKSKQRAALEALVRRRLETSRYGKVQSMIQMKVKVTVCPVSMSSLPEVLLVCFLILL